MDDGRRIAVRFTHAHRPSSGLAGEVYGGWKSGSATTVLSPAGASTRGIGDAAPTVGARIRPLRSV